MIKYNQDLMKEMLVLLYDLEDNTSLCNELKERIDYLEKKLEEVL